MISVGMVIFLANSLISLSPSRVFSRSRWTADIQVYTSVIQEYTGVYCIQNARLLEKQAVSIIIQVYTTQNTSIVLYIGRILEYTEDY